MGLLRNRNIDASNSATAFREATRRVGADQRAQQVITRAGVQVFDRASGQMRSMIDITSQAAALFPCLGRLPVGIRQGNLPTVLKKLRRLLRLKPRLEDVVSSIDSNDGAVQSMVLQAREHKHKLATENLRSGRLYSSREVFTGLIISSLALVVVVFCFVGAQGLSDPSDGLGRVVGLCIRGGALVFLVGLAVLARGIWGHRSHHQVETQASGRFGLAAAVGVAIAGLSLVFCAIAMFPDWGMFDIEWPRRTFYLIMVVAGGLGGALMAGRFFLQGFISGIVGGPCALFPLAQVMERVDVIYIDVALLLALAGTLPGIGLFRLLVVWEGRGNDAEAT